MTASNALQMNRAAYAGILCLAISGAASAAGPACEITSFGIFGSNDLVGTRPAPGAAAGRERLFETDGVTQKTTTIPGRLGLRFGVTHKFREIPAGEFVQEIIRHPPLPKHGGGTTTESQLKKDPSTFGSDFGFDYPHEIVHGEWSFEFYFRGKLLCRQAFQVVEEPGVGMWTRGARAQAGPDAVVIAQLKKAGSNLSKPHAIEFFLYFPVREGAERVAEKIRAAGFAAKVDRAAKGPDWVVLATKTMVPTESALANVRRDFEAWASAEKGEYDGWGTPVVE